ncbi:hypothetical protein [Bacterioplanoides sp. SCSIO 12839]|uniref:hypothetical protein n=1 Tax=Bacterioplanoides sp. SCSIO 12839 TaxID=2829569 RepID=UPI002105FD49|nr:hypothetical protein [Bacterioplanoides sp. SCSIO 12839]UTW49619.1 hypothetical protein KFF03_06955 [Bacterioplanoides sp. SCSIO 12839]
MADLKKNSQLLYQSDDNSFILYQKGSLRWLSFGDRAVQAVINMDCPDVPYLPTVRLMLMTRYFANYQAKEEHFRILNLGMGGASVERFFTRILPDATLHSVEINRELIAAIQKNFVLPPEHIRGGMEIFPMDAERFLKQRASDAASSLYNIILMDHLTSRDPVDVLSQCEYAAAMLDSDGCLAINLIPEDDLQLRDFLLVIREHFPCTRIIDLPGYRNVVVFARLQPFSQMTLDLASSDQLHNPAEEQAWLERMVSLPDKER